MNKTVSLIFILCPLWCLSQLNIANPVKASPQIFAYKINASLAEKFIKQDSIDVDIFLDQAPAAKFARGHVDERKLVHGFYVLIDIVDNRISASLMGVSDLIVYPINNKHRVQLFITNKNEQFITDAQVQVNGKPAPFIRESQSYRVKQKDPENALIKVITAGDTLFTSLWISDETEESVSTQRKKNFNRTRLARTISWLPTTITGIFKHRRRYRSTNEGTSGMMVFNQPKYKQTDTVKLKAYVFSKSRHLYRHPVKVYLEYHALGKYHKNFLKALDPSSPGSFVYQLPLSDSFHTDINYSVVFRTSNDRQILSKTFRLEEYLLDDISSYNFRSVKETYYPVDTLHFEASASDANGLSLLDCQTSLVITTVNILKFYPDTLYVPDTIYTEKKGLTSIGETKYDIPASTIPGADLSLTAQIEFLNSNNEIQEKEVDINFRKAERELKAYVDNDSVFAVLRVNGKAVTANGKLHINNDRMDSLDIQFPFSRKVDPFTQSYSFYILQNDKKTDSAEATIPGDYQMVFHQLSIKDSLGFVLENVNRIPVFYTVFDGNRIIGMGKSSNAAIKWLIKAPHKTRAYRVSWQYYWKEEEQTQERSIALLHKLLNIEITNNDKVFPGQTDTILVHVKDYKDRPVAGVNLTALSYNNQFGKDIRVPDPPYLVKYKSRSHIKRNIYEGDDAYLIKKYPLGQHYKWMELLATDSMLYYKMLFPSKGMFNTVTPISDFLPQVSVHLSKSGERQEIYLLYLNRKLAYYNGVTDKTNDAYLVYPGYCQIGVRLYDRLIEIDSVYIQPNYKHDLFFDIDKLPAHATVSMLSPVMTYNEKLLLENSLWSLDNNSQTNFGYIWQGEKLIRLSGNRTHLAGPFNQHDSLHFFAPGNFDIDFRFEPGYVYNLSNKVLRLEKRTLFPNSSFKYALPVNNSPEWILGDTIISKPVKGYDKPAPQKTRGLRFSPFDAYGTRKEGNGKLLFTVIKDTVLRYVILFQDQYPDKKMVLPGAIRHVNNIIPGEYWLLLVAENGHSTQIDKVIIKANQTFCIHTEKELFVTDNPLLTRWLIEAEVPVYFAPTNTNRISQYSSENMPAYQAGNAGISGKIIDESGGFGIPGVSIMINHYNTGVVTDKNGNFMIRNIKAGKCVLSISSVGYISKLINIQVPENGYTNVDVSLLMSSQSLDDVVVTAYGISRKNNLTGSISTITVNDITSANKYPNNNILSGKMAGVSVDNHGESDDNTNIVLRGASALTTGQRILYIIDGILYDEMPRNVSPDMIDLIFVFKNDEATALYGSRAANGAVVISTKSKSVRNKFRDYAFWQPELFTDENGMVKFKVEYPDNITGWQIYVLGMDRKRRMGKSFSLVKSYKPLMAQISMPQFLIEGDTAEIIGKALNHSSENYPITSSFTTEGMLLQKENVLLKTNESFIQKHQVIAGTRDSLKSLFSIVSSTGFKDGEERAIPVIKKGTIESVGKFWILDKDTSIVFNPASNSSAIECFVQNNTLDVLLEEINYLKKYPYYCMEQTASKLRGLLMEKIIREKLQQKFGEDKTINVLLEKLQKAQLFEGGWSWWESGRANFYITNYIINTLLPLRTEKMVEINVRNGLLFLQNQLPYLGKGELVSSLLTMTEAHHQLDYNGWLKKINFDSLPTNEQWKFIKIQQGQNMQHENELLKVMRNAEYGLLGSLHWGEENYQWHNDEDATTVLAFEVLSAEKNHDKELKAIIQYFLERRRTGYWQNTVASASIIAAILPYALSNNNDFRQQAELKITGDTSITITNFPAKMIFKNNSNQQLNISKSGGGITYLTLYQHTWNLRPEPVNHGFFVRSFFEKNNKKIAHLNSGEKIKLVVEVTVTKEADYVMIEVPIPAGCVYGSKAQDNFTNHKEFLKNKVVIFSESLTKGIHRFEVNLETRFNGSFTLNPAKASLMYFPTFYGRNDMQLTDISPN